MKAKLIVVGGTTSTTEVNLRLPTLIGRGRNVQVAIPHSLVSRKHCEISEFEGRLMVRDLDSMNGTYIGNERITEAVLEPNALLTVGTVTFRAIYEIGSDTDSLSDDSDDTCLGDDLSSEAEDSIGTELQQSTDVETVPLSEGSLGESLLPPRLPDRGEALEEETTPSLSDLSDASSLESAAKKSD